MSSSPFGALAPVRSLFARTRGIRLVPLLGLSALSATVLISCGGSNETTQAAAAPPPPAPLTASINVISGPAQYVSGGDARIEIQAPTAEHANLELRLNGAVVTPTLVAGENR
jgi:hypothetical protein